MKRTLTPKQKEEILKRDSYTCVYCLGAATEVDHVVPFSWSQCDAPDNLVSACHICNQIAGDLVFANFDLKFEYIRATRQKPKWAKRLPERLPKLLGRQSEPTSIYSFSASEIFRRDNYQCQSCRKRFEVQYLGYYHITPQTDEADTKNLVTLCKPCYDLVKRDGLKTRMSILYYKKILDQVAYIQIANQRIKW